jgi:hypothetical protein
MAEKVKRPNVVGKGPKLIREMVEILKEVEGALGNIDGDAAAKVKAVAVDLRDEIEPIVARAYVKTVKAGETAWDCKEASLELKAAVEAGEGDKAAEIAGTIEKDLGEFVNKIKTFVVRMT